MTQHTRTQDATTVKTFFNACRLAMSFLTRIPVGRQSEASNTEWRWFVAGFPPCGYVLGCVAFAAPALLRVYMGAEPLRSLLLACLSVSVMAYLTRGLHLDGFADMCDAYGGGYDRTKRLEIMKDPRVGSFAVIGLCLLLAIKITALAIVVAANRIVLAGAVVVMSRFFLGLMTAVGRYARKQGTAVRVVGNVSLPAMLTAAIFTAPCLLLPEMRAVGVVMCVLMLLLNWQANRALGGVTGDILGACCELCEAAGYVVVALQLGSPWTGAT